MTYRTPSPVAVDAVSGRVHAHRAALLGALLVALALKGVLVLAQVVAFESDEAVVGLMGRHILEGARPTFYYGQAYMGSLDAWLVAFSFALLGETVLAIRVVQVLLFLVHVYLTYVLARMWSSEHRVAVLSALLVALPPVLLTLYTTASLGGYGETLVIGDLLLLVGWYVVSRYRSGLGWWAILGLLAGVGFWTLGLVVVYLLPLGVLLLWRYRARAWKGFLIALLLFAVGVSPWLAYNAQHSWVGVRTLYDPAAERDPMSPVVPIGQRLAGLLLIGLPGLVGVRLPWLKEWLPLAMVPLVVGFYGVVAWHAFSQARRRAWGGAYRLLWGLGVTTIVLLVFSRFGSDPTGRYLLPLYTPLCIFSAAAIAAAGRAWRWATPVLVSAVVALNLWSTWVTGTSVQGLTPQYDPRLQYGNDYDEALIAFLESSDGSRGYSTYWIAYKTAFLSQERVILDASLPYKQRLSGSGLDNRYLPYVGTVAAAREIVYATGGQPELDALLRDRFAGQGITYRERQIGPYRVFHELSSPVSPVELGLP